MSPKRRRPTPEDLETVAELRLALRRFQSATDAVTSARGLTPRQYDLLAILHAPSRVGAVASSLADEIGISRNAMTELLSRAQEAGLVVRDADRSDTRRKPIAPTRDGTRRYYATVIDLQPERDRLVALLRRAMRKAQQLA